MAKKTRTRGGRKTAQKAAPKSKKTKAKKARGAAKGKKTRKAASARKMRRVKPKAAEPKAATSRTPAQVKTELREEFVIEQGNAALEDYFTSGSEHFGL
jgi:hypothetical protein